MPVERTQERPASVCVCIAQAGFIPLWESWPNRTCCSGAERSYGRCCAPIAFGWGKASRGMMPRCSSPPSRLDSRSTMRNRDRVMTLLRRAGPPSQPPRPSAACNQRPGIPGPGLRRHRPRPAPTATPGPPNQSIPTGRGICAHVNSTANRGQSRSAPHMRGRSTVRAPAWRG